LLKASLKKYIKEWNKKKDKENIKEEEDE